MTTADRLEKLHEDLTARLNHAQTLAVHSPTSANLQSVRAIQAALCRLNEVRTAWLHGQLRHIGKAWLPTEDNVFVTETELAARKFLSSDRRVSYLN